MSEEPGHHPRTFARVQLRELALDLLTGVLLAVSASLLIHPVVSELLPVWGTFYGEF